MAQLSPTQETVNYYRASTSQGLQQQTPRGSGLLDAQQAISIDMGLVTCYHCKQIPIIDYSASECTNCQQLFCEPCLNEWYSGKSNKKCEKCGQFKEPPYTRDISEKNKRELSKLKVVCKYRDQGCQKELPVTIELLNHEQNCEYAIKSQQRMKESEVQDQSQSHVIEETKSQQQLKPKEQINISEERKTEKNQEYDQEKTDLMNYQSQELIHKVELLDLSKVDETTRLKLNFLGDKLRVLQQKSQINSQQIQEESVKLKKLTDKNEKSEGTIQTYNTLISVLLIFIVLQLLLSHYGSLENFLKHFHLQALAKSFRLS